MDALLDDCVPDVFARRVLLMVSALQHSLRHARDAAAHRCDLRGRPVCQFTGLLYRGLAIGMLGFASERARHVAGVAACDSIQLRETRYTSDTYRSAGGQCIHFSKRGCLAKHAWGY